MLPGNFFRSTVSIAPDGRDAKLAVGRELTKGNSFPAGSSKMGIEQTVPLSA